MNSTAGLALRRVSSVAARASLWASVIRQLGFLGLIVWLPIVLGESPQTLVWNSPGVSTLVIGKPEPITVVSSSGLPVTLQVDRGPALIADGTITATRVGTIRVTAKQAGNTEFLPASVTRIFNRSELRGTVVAALDVPGKVRVQGNLLFVGGPALEIFEINNPASPVFRGRLDVGVPIRDVVPAGRHVLVTSGNFLRIADVSQPDRPTWVGSLDLTSPGGNIAVEGSLASVTRPPHIFSLVDWSDPRNPQSVANLIASFQAKVDSIAQRNGWVYVSGDGLPVTGYSIPFTNPGPSGDRVSLWVPNSQMDSDSRSLVMAQDFSIGILDLTQPEKAPSSIRIPFGIPTDTIRLHEPWVYLSSSAVGLWAVDVVDSAEPQRSPQRLLGESVQSVDAVSGYVFAGRELGPTTIIRVDERLKQEFTGLLPSDLWVTNGPLTVNLSITGPTGTPATIKLTSGPAILSGNQLTITNAGSIGGTLFLPGNDQFFELNLEWWFEARKLEQSIVFNPAPSIGARQGPFPLQAVASSRLPVEFGIVSGPATVEGRNLVPNGVGTVVVRATQPGDLAYLPAEPVLATIEIVELPELLREPHPTNVMAGSPVTLEVSASGPSTPRFQWYKDGTPLPNETETVLHREAASPLDMGLYHVVTSLDSGGAITSSVVSLTVDLPGSEVRLRPRGSVRHRPRPSNANPGRIEVVGDHAYVVNQGLAALQVLNIQNPDAPRLARTVPLLSTLHQDLVHKDGYLLLAEREQGIGILDLATPDNPVRLPSYRFPWNRADVVTVQVIGNQAFVGNGSYGFAILDVTNPRQPALISSFDTRGLVAGVWIQGENAYLADWGAGFKVVNFADPAAPRLIGYYPEPESSLNYYDLVSRDSWVYLVHQDIGLVTFDLSFPTLPAVTHTNRGSIIGVDLSGRTLFAADNASQITASRTPGVRLFDLRRPGNPIDIGRFNSWGGMDGVRLEGNRLFVTGDRFGIIDIEFPQRPPHFAVEPQSRIVQFGELGRLSCVVEGSDPISYQWWYQGVPLHGATNRSLSVGPVTDDNAGLYTVEVRNPWGTIRSTPARLGFPQHIRWDALPTNSVLHIRRPHDLPAKTDRGLPVSFRILSGPATITKGELWITNVGAVRLIAEQAGSDTLFPVAREWTLNVGSVRFVERGRWPDFHPGSVAAMDSDGDLAVVAIWDGGLLALDVSDPRRPLKLGEFWNGGHWRDVRLSQGIAYALNDVSGLTIVDFRDPGRPVLKSTSDPSGIGNRIELGDRRVCLYDSNPIRMVDVTDPSAPVFRSIFEEFGGYDQLVVRGGRAFASRAVGGLEVIDIQDPENWVRLSLTHPTRRAGLIAVDGNRLAILPLEGGLELYRVTENGDLETLGRVDLPRSAIRVDWSGEHLWLILDQREIIRVDVTDPHRPVVLKAAELPSLADPTSIHVRGAEAYVIDAMHGLIVYGGGFEGEPKAMGWFSTSGGADAVRVDSNRAYVRSLMGGFNILDVADPDRLAPLGGLPSNNGLFSAAAGSLAVSGSRAFYSDGFDVRIVDVGNPAVPTVLGSIPSPGVVWVQAPNEAELHLGGSGVRTMAYDVRNPAAPVLVSTSPNQLEPIQVSGHLRIGGRRGVLRVEDVSSPDSPVPLGSLNLETGVIKTIAIAGDQVFVGSFSSSLTVVDLSDPRRPVRTQQSNGRGSSDAMEVEGDYLFAAQGPGGLAVYHANLPTGIQLAGWKGGFTNAKDLQVVGDLVYVADDGVGLRILQIVSGIEQTIPDLPPSAPMGAGTTFELPGKSDAGLPVHYTVLNGNGFVEEGRLRLPSEGEVRIQAEIEGNLQFFPSTIERTYHVLSLPAIAMEATESGLRIRWKPGIGIDLLEVSESILGPWQNVEILSVEYLEAEAMQVMTVPKPPSTQYYRVLRQ